jgi:hypothetical protein
LEPESKINYVDIESIKKTFGDDPDILSEFMDLFSKHFPADVCKLAKAFDEKNIEQVFTVAHNLKTTVSSLKRNTPLLEPLRVIEQYRYTQEVDWHTIEENIAVLTNAKEKVLKDIRTLQENLHN